MKNIYIVIILCFLSCGTDQDRGNTYNYKVVNDTDKDIEVKAFNDETNESISTFIAANSEIEKTYTSRSPDPLNGDLYDYSLFFGGRSIQVIFNNERFLIFEFDPVCSNDFDNPLNRCEYADTNEVFIFTEAFYDRAEPCDGNCD